MVFVSYFGTIRLILDAEMDAHYFIS